MINGEPVRMAKDSGLEIAKRGSSKEILCTLGPASLNERIIPRLEELGASLFRINLSHTPLDAVAPTIERIRKCTAVPICLDTEGAQIRTGALSGDSVTLHENALVYVPFAPIEGNSRVFNFYPDGIAQALEPGDFLSIDFNSVFAQVIEKSANTLVIRVLHSGRVGRNKAVTVQRPIHMPSMTDKDRAAVQIGRDLGITHFALSFAHRASDVDGLRALVGADAFIISKIECRYALHNLDAIAEKSDAVLIDRGDLSRDLPIEKIPEAQKRVIRRAKEAGIKSYVATNLLESMVFSSSPTRAEVNDVYNTLADGVDGLVLAAETAIGDYPIQCAAMIAKMIYEFENPPKFDGAYYTDERFSLLMPPHGGALVQRQIAPGQLSFIDGMQELRVRNTDLLDCEQISSGTYSPLDGFMDRETLEGVLNDCRLPEGTIWTLPVVLQVEAARAERITKGETVALTGSDGSLYAMLDVTDIYRVNIDDVAKKWFGTESQEHPGVERLFRFGEHFIGGKVTMVRPSPSSYREFQLTPAQTRLTFSEKGWSRVVGFHTRNAIHRAHEHIQLQALERTGADGLFISPVTGPKKRNDFLPGPIMKSYQLMLENGFYPEGKVVLACFSTYSRYCGPREAVFTALCRKNMGCSHFIVGRDHTGVGDLYSLDANQRMFDQLGDIGIEPVFFETVGFDEQSGDYRPLSEGGTEPISGSQVRDRLRSGEPLPEWFMRPEVQAMLRQEIASGHQVFHD